MSILVILYYFGFLIYMIYLVVENWVYKDDEYIEKYSILIVPFKNKNISQRLLPSIFLLRKISV